MTVLSIATRIVQSPKILGNQPHIEGRRIRVKDIVLWYEVLGMSADEIADVYDLTLADVFAGLAFYHLHQSSLRAQWDREQVEIARIKSKTPSKINKLELRAAG